MAASSHTDYSSAAELRRSPAASSIVDLRNLLAGRFPQSPAPSRSCLKTGIATLDKATEGGLAKNCITELISPQINAGSAGMLHALLHTAHRDRYFLALIDGRDSFDPATAGIGVYVICFGPLPQRSPSSESGGPRFADGNFPLVILDLVLNPADELRKIPQTSWYRLQRLVELIPSACLVLTRRSIISSAQWKLTLDNAWTLQDLENGNPLSRLNIAVRRVHGAQQMAGGV